MLLRSTSTPILTSWAQNPREAEPEWSPHRLTRTNSFSRTASYNYNSDLMGNPTRPERDSVGSGRYPGLKPPAPARRRRRSVELTVAEVATAEVGGGIGSGGGRICGGGRGGGRGGSDGGDGFDSTEAYYRKMIELDPSNSLVLGNYAKFLKEVRGDLVKAEEYCGRAILTNPNDGNVLSLYGDLIWQTERDSSRAESYFEQAVKTDPDDCYVQASYARFLWNAEEEEDENKEEVHCDMGTNTMMSSKFLKGASHSSPLTTAS